MSDKADFTGTVNSKKLTGTGITPGILRRHHASKSGRMVIVAAVHVAQTHDNVEDGTGAVNYVIDDLEVAPAIAEEHVRELIRSFHYERKLTEEGPMLDDDGLTPSIGDAVASGIQHAPHPFLPTDAADDTTSCEVCGLGEVAAPHRAYITGDDQARQLDDEYEEQPVPTG